MGRPKKEDKNKTVTITLPEPSIKFGKGRCLEIYQKNRGFSTYIAELIKLDEQHDLINKYGESK